MMFKIEEEERRLEAAIEESERQNAEVNAELKELELKSSRFKELEERYIFTVTLSLAILYFQIKIP
jgi:beclin 1